MANYIKIPGLKGDDPNSFVYIHNNRGYLVNKKVNDALYLKCRGKKCPGRACIMDNCLIESDGSYHTCTSSPHEWEAMKAKAEMKEMARTTSRKLTEIYEDIAARYEVDTVKLIPYWRVQPSLVNERKKRIPKTPDTAEEIIQELEDGIHGGDYVDYYLGSLEVEKDGKVLPAILLGDPHLIQKVCAEGSTFFVDATFRTSPQPFPQVLNIMANYKNIKVPVMHVSMPSKDYEVYLKVFEKIVELFPSFKPSTIMSDFERGLRSALSQVFPDARLAGCRFHFSKALVKNLTKSKFFYQP